MASHYGPVIDQLMDDLEDMAILRPNAFLTAYEAAKLGEIAVVKHGPKLADIVCGTIANWWDAHYPPRDGQIGIHHASLLQAVLARVRCAAGG